MEESDLINQLRDIVGNEAIAPDVDFDHAALRDKLPLATCALFSFDSVLLFGNRTLFVRPTASIKPEILLSQSELISSALQAPVVCHLDTITPYLRKRLIAARAPFLTQAGEFYLPGLLRTIPSPATKPRPLDTELTAMGKTAFLHFLYYGGTPSTIKDVCARTGLSRGEPSGPARNFSATGCCSEGQEAPPTAPPTTPSPTLPHTLKKAGGSLAELSRRHCLCPATPFQRMRSEAAFPPSPLALFSWHRRRLFLR